MTHARRHLIPSTKLTSSSHKTFHFSYMKFLDEMFVKVKVSSILRKKKIRIERVGLEFGASDLECITLIPTPPKIWWLILVWFKYITLTLTLTLLCVRIINVSTSVWRMELGVGRSAAQSHASFTNWRRKKWRKTRRAILLFVLSTKTTKERFLLKLCQRNGN